MASETSFRCFVNPWTALQSGPILMNKRKGVIYCQLPTNEFAGLCLPSGK